MTSGPTLRELDHAYVAARADLARARARHLELRSLARGDGAALVEARHAEREAEERVRALRISIHLAGAWPRYL